MSHIEQRLAERNIKIDPANLQKIATYFGNTSAAVLLGKVEFCGQKDGAYRTRQESNGELVILIVRNGVPVTIMYRRENQPFSAEALHVRSVHTL